ncbi:hypothetical protein ACW5F0_14275 [Luteimonas sp. A534]
MPRKRLTALQAVALMLATLMAACKPAVPRDVPGLVDAAPEGWSAEASSNLASLPQVPGTEPNSWVPYAVEKRMGAEWCPEDPDDERGRKSGILNRPCFGLLPRHLAEVLVAIPEGDIFLPVVTRARHALLPQKYLALPGYGERPDFMAVVDILEGITLRSFEGVRPADTVYLVEGPFRCIDNDPVAVAEGEYLLQTTACQAAQADIRLYKWSTGAGSMARVQTEMTIRSLKGKDTLHRQEAGHDQPAPDHAYGYRHPYECRTGNFAVATRTTFRRASAAGLSM